MSHFILCLVDTGTEIDCIYLIGLAFYLSIVTLILQVAFICKYNEYIPLITSLAESSKVNYSLLNLY